VLATPRSGYKENKTQLNQLIIVWRVNENILFFWNVARQTEFFAKLVDKVVIVIEETTEKKINFKI